jgi:hypothetical protein
MPKKVPPKKQPLVPRRKSWNKRPAVLAIILVLSLVGIILAQWRSFKRTANPFNLIPQTSPTPQLTKEYIYAGGKLIATEEPTTGGGPSPLSAPASLIATGTTTPSLQVNLSWAASTGGTVDHYVIERCQTFAANCYSVVASNVAPNTPTINYSDASVTSGMAYLYRVRAVDSNGNFSSYSSADLATAISFQDDPLTSTTENQSAATPIRAVHLTQLRSAVNAVRALAGIAAASWTYPDPVSNPPEQRRTIYLEDLTEMRSKLDEALIILGMSQSYSTNPPLARGSAISAAHFSQIRARVK